MKNKIIGRINLIPKTSNLTTFDEVLVKLWLKQITIWDDRCTVELKSGVSIDVDA